MGFIAVNGKVYVWGSHDFDGGLSLAGSPPAAIRFPVPIQGVAGSDFVNRRVGLVQARAATTIVTSAQPQASHRKSKLAQL